MRLSGALMALAALALAGCGGSHPKGFATAETRYFSFSRPQGRTVQIVRPAQPSRPGEIVARSLGAAGTHRLKPLIAVDATPGWTIDFDGLVTARALDDGLSYGARYRELGRTSPRVRGAVGARLIKGEAPGRDGAPVRTFDLIALSKGQVAVHMIVEVPRADMRRVPVQDILDSLALRA